MIPASEPEAVSSASASDRGRQGAAQAYDGEPARLGGGMTAALPAPPSPRPEAAAQEGTGRRTQPLDALDVAAEEALVHAVITPDGGMGGLDALGRPRTITVAPKSSAQLAAATVRSVTRKSPSIMPSDDADPVSIQDLAHMLSPGVEPPAFSLSDGGAASVRGSRPVPALDASPTPRIPAEASGAPRTTVDGAALVRSLLSPERGEKGATERGGAISIEARRGRVRDAGVDRRAPTASNRVEDRPSPPPRWPLTASEPPPVSPPADTGDVAAFRAVSELRPRDVRAMASLVPTSERTPATRRSRPEVDAAQPPDSSREDLNLMESLCPPPSRPGRTSAPDLGAQAARGDSSGLIDLRRMAATSDVDRRRDRELRADDEVLAIQGGLFEGASVPPLAPPPLDGAEPDAGGGEPPAEDDVPGRVSALVSQGARLVTSPAAQQNVTIVGWVLGVFLVFGVALYFAHPGTRSAASSHAHATATASDAPPAPTPAPVAPGARAADREPSLDDEPPAPAASAAPGASATAASSAEPPPAAAPALSASSAASPPPEPSPAAAPSAAAPGPPGRPEPNEMPLAAERPPAIATTSKAEWPPVPAPTAAPPPQASAEFDRIAANEALAAAASVAAGCTGEGLTGSARVAVTFGPSGQVASARVEAGDLVGTATAGCIAGAFRSARVPPFEGGHITVMKQVNIR